MSTRASERGTRLRVRRGLFPRYADGKDEDDGDKPCADGELYDPHLRRAEQGERQPQEGAAAREPERGDQKSIRPDSLDGAEEHAGKHECLYGHTVTLFC